MKLNWTWFMSVDFRGDWIMTKGWAHLQIDVNKISGFMFFDEKYNEADIYARFSGYFDDDNFAVVTVSSAQEGTPEFEVSGPIFSFKNENILASSFILTDGTTVLGFTNHAEL
ncbi:hypothetical protein [Solimicrobium silvestre]|nr:hypothetical protein [Solimicrobium silvestre]